MTIIKTALLSFGMSGKVFHAPFIQIHPGFELAGAWERNTKLIQETYPEAISYDSLESILTDSTVDLVVVNTPTDTHFDYAAKALIAGKHVAVEKAFTTTVQEAMQLKEIAERQQKQIAVFQNRRWDSDFQTVQHVINSGILRELNEVEIHFDRFKTSLSPKQHKELPGPGAGILKDLGPHIIDQALCLFGTPQKVFADIRITRPGSQVDDWFDIVLYYPTIRVRLKAGYMVKEPLPAYILHGINGSFLKSRADTQEAKLLAGKVPLNDQWGSEPVSEMGTINYEKNGHSVKEKVNTINGNYMQFYDLVHKAIQNGEPMPITADDGVAIMKVIELAIKSSELQCAVDFD